MPRKKRRCKERSSTRLDLLLEMNLVQWSPMIPGTEFGDIADMRSAWLQHGDRILARHIECLPGSRPAAMYFLQLIELPPVVNPARADDTAVRWGDKTYLPRWRYFGCSTGTDDHYQGGEAWGELQWLHKIGVVDDTEYARALPAADDRFYDPDRPWRHYEPLSHDEHQVVDTE